MIWRRNLLTLILLFMGLCVNGATAATIATLTINEEAAATTTNYPLTFGHVFKKGVIQSGQMVEVAVNNTTLSTQFDEKANWPDGSVRHAVISVILPQVTADQTLSLSLEGPVTNNSNTGEMTKQQILDTGIAADIELTGLSDSGYSGSLSADLRAAITAQSTMDYWLKGSVCTEILITQTLNNSLDATWEVRAYPTIGQVRISHGINNVNWQSRGNVTYTLAINQGSPSTEVYSKDSFKHNHSSRWRKVFWLGTEPSEVEIHYDLSYWASTGMVLPYDTDLQATNTEIQNFYDLWLAEDRDVMGQGSINYYFPATGGRPEIGILPKWSALYLTTMDNRAREMVLNNGQMAGSIPIHFREDDIAQTFYGKPVSIEDRPTFDINGNSSLPSIGTTATDWYPDRAHQGSFAYLPYLITGEKWFYDEVMYWGGWNLAYDSYNRNGDGNIQDFSAGKDYSEGIIYDQLRAVSWGMRTIANAVSVATPTDSAYKQYLADKLQNNVDWLTLANSDTTGHGLGQVRHSRELIDGNWSTTQGAPWMHDFLLMVLIDIERKDIITTATVSALISRFSQFTIGRFTHPEDLPQFEGAGFWWPLCNINNDYYTSGNWADLWADIKTRSGTLTDETAKTSYSTWDYAFSYPAIAMGVLHLLPASDDRDDAIEFLSENLSYDSWAAEDPTWAFTTEKNDIITIYNFGWTINRD